MRLVGFVGVAASTLAGAAVLQTPSPARAGVDPSISQVCGQVLGLSSGESHFVACTQTLARVQRDVGRRDSLNWARSQCLQQGLRPGDPSLGVCELQTAGRAPPRTIPSYLMGEGRPEPYYMMSNGEVVHRVQLACAEMGLDPAGAAFGGCQVSLQAALFNADNPSH